MSKSSSSLGFLIGAGALAGLAGTGAIMALQAFDERYRPRTIPPITEDPGQYFVRTAERATGTLPETVEQTVAKSMGPLYGATFGALYGALRGGRDSRAAVKDGVMLGILVYAVGYLGWLPALGLGKPAWKQNLPQVAGELTRHVGYGLATSATFALAIRLWGRAHTSRWSRVKGTVKRKVREAVR